MIRKKLYFDDVFADIFLMHTFNHATFKGAEIGECLAAASKVVEGNAESWRRAWQEQGKRPNERAGRPTIVDMGSAPGRPICAPSRTTTMRAWRSRSTIRPTAQAWNTIARSSSGSRR
jgi:hypothetical protein